jgi:hypothetical protein
MAQPVAYLPLQATPLRGLVSRFVLVCAVDELIR